MVIMDWADSGEIKELHCGEKPVVVQCWSMGCLGFCILVSPEYQQ